MLTSSTADLKITLQLRGGGPFELPVPVNVAYEVKVSDGYRFFKLGRGKEGQPAARALTPLEIESLVGLVGALRFPQPERADRQMMDAGYWELNVQSGLVEIRASSYDEWPVNWLEVRALHDFIEGLTGF
jgi:hypothetical protein